MEIQELQTNIKRIQAKIRAYRRSILENRNFNTNEVNRYLTLIDLAKQEIKNLIQLEDDIIAIEYSEARYIPTNNRYNNPTSIL